jgi:hypothetical protein
VSSPSGKSKKRAAPAPWNPAPVQAIVRPVALAAVVVLAAALLANSMTKEVGRDEQMYCTAGVLLSRGEVIYRDFSYPSQLPYHPLLLAAVYKSLGTTHYLLAGRLVSAVCDILVLAFILLIYRSLFGTYRLAGLLCGLAAALLYVFNPLVDYAAGYAWNHDVVILGVVASLWLFLTTDFPQRPRWWRTAAIGALLTFATCMRVTTAIVELLFLIALFFTAAGTWKDRSKTALPFTLAALAVLLWPVWVVAQAPQAFWLNLVRIPALYGRWLHEIGMTFNKVRLTVGSLLTPGYLVLLILAGCLFWVLWRNRSSLSSQERRKAGFAALLPLAFFVIAYIPPTMWHQYLAAPVPFLAVGLACPLLALRRRADTPGRGGRYQAASALLALGAAIAILALPTVLYRSVFLLVPEKWTPVELHKESLELTAKVKEPAVVLTLGPLYALEGGRDIYRELACGSIIYRVADQMSPEERQVTRTVGPQTLAELVKGRPPAAVIVGVESSRFASLEDPLRRLVPAGWSRQTFESARQVYVRP